MGGPARGRPLERPMERRGIERQEVSKDPDDDVDEDVGPGFILEEAAFLRLDVPQAALDELVSDDDRDGPYPGQPGEPNEEPGAEVHPRPPVEGGFALAVGHGPPCMLRREEPSG